MTKVPGIKYKQVGNLYGLRNWVEYGLKQSKDELGWADFRLTDYSQIKKWWEVVMSAYLMVSLHTNPLNPAPTSKLDDSIAPIVKKFDSHASVGSRQGLEKYPQQFAFSYPTFYLFQFNKTLAQSVSHSSLIFRVFSTNCSNELLPWGNSNSYIR